MVCLVKLKNLSCWLSSKVDGLVRKRRGPSNQEGDTPEESEEMGSPTCCSHPAFSL